MVRRVGFIGLGLMGLPMAKNILKKGFLLSVYNRTSQKTEELRVLGATVVSTLAELGKTCDVVISIVTGPRDVEEVLLEVCQKPKEGLITIDMSTIGPTAARAIAAKLSKRGVLFADAPVTGSVVRATSGELTIFVGADAKTFKTIKPVLSTMGNAIHHMGSVGMGQAIKLVNNYFVAVEAVALSEGMILADSMGLDRKKAAEVLQSASTGMSPIMKLIIGDLANSTYPLIFSLANMHKDISLSLSEMQSPGTLMPVVKRVFDMGVRANLGDKNFSIIHKVVERRVE